MKEKDDKEFIEKLFVSKFYKAIKETGYFSMETLDIKINLKGEQEELQGIFPKYSYNLNEELVVESDFCLNYYHC